MLQTLEDKHHFRFLDGGGEMGQRTRNYNWSATGLGDATTWPPALRTTLGTLLHAAVPMVLFWGPQAICFYNDAFHAGLAKQSLQHGLLGSKAGDAFAQDWAQIGALVDQVRNTGKPVFLENRQPSFWRSHHMQQVRSSLHCSPVLSDDGTIAGVLLLITESDTFQPSDNELVYQKSLLETVTQNTDMALFMMDENQYCIYMNEAAERMTGYSLKELRGKQLHYYVHHTHPDGSPYPVEECPIDQALPAHKRMKGEETFVHKDGSFYPVAFTASPIIIDGKAIGTVIEVRNTAEEKAKEQELLDITKRQEETLAILETLLKNAPVGVGFFDREHRYLRINETLAEINGIDAEAHIGRKVEELLPDLAGLVAPILQEVMTTGKPALNLEIKGATPKAPGETRYWLSSFYPVWNERTREVDFIGVVVTEITDRKKAEIATRESEERLNLVIATANLGLWDYNIITDVAALSERTRKLYNLDAEAVFTFQNLLTHVHPADRERIAALNQKILFDASSATDYFAEFRTVDDTGASRWLRSLGKVLLNEQGQRYRFIGAVSDITEEKLAAQALQESEERFRTMAEALPQMVWMTDAAGNMEYASREWEEYSGMSDPSAAWDAMLHPDDRASVQALWEQSFAAGMLSSYEVRLRHKSGEYRWHYSVAKPVKDASGKIWKWIGSLTDIQVQKTFSEKLEKEVAERTRELHRSNEDLMQFAHVASHDLKEPVRKIRMFENRLRDEYGSLLPDTGKLYLSKIESATERMYAMIEGVLLYSSLDVAEQVQESIDLNEMFLQIEADLEVVIERKSALVKVAELPVITGAKTLIYQLFYNLMNNALKFTAPARIPVVVVSSEIIEQGSQVQIRISDNGIGFDQSKATEIFKTFTRLNPKDSYEGTGLGLALCKKIAQRCNAAIAAEGVAGSGATFIVTLPL